MIEDLSNVPVTTDNMLHYIAKGWDALHVCLAALTDEQITGPTDAAGWTVKDHMIHLPVWEMGLLALLDGKPEYEAMGVDKATWDAGVDATNTLIQQQYRDMPLAEVREMMQSIHVLVIARVAAMSDDDLMRPYRDYQPDIEEDNPIYGWIVGNTFGHYDEHIPWIQAIVAGG